MTTQTKVRCPSPGCASLFVVPAKQLGRSTQCPACGVRMTARPLEVERQLVEQQLRIAGGQGASIDRLPFVVLLDNIRSLWNVGSIFRTADACGVERIVLTGITGCPPRPELTKTALGAEESVAWEYAADPVAALERLVEAGIRPVALEMSDRATPLDRFEWSPGVALIVGNEVAGVGGELLRRCNDHLALPMLGVKSSFNVAVAFGIAAFAASRALAAAGSEGVSCD